MDEIKPGDWVVWSDYRSDQSDVFFELVGPGPFQVAMVDELYIRLKHPKSINFYPGRFRKSVFITAVKEALKGEAKDG
jgi:hypothetical protein